MAWPIEPVLGDRLTDGGAGAATAVAGPPSLTAPMGAIDGLPVGLVLPGRTRGEAELLALGYAFAQQTRAGRPPISLATLNSRSWRRSAG